jgi:hypothetical protein
MSRWRRRVWLFVVNCASVSSRPRKSRRIARRVSRMRRPALVFLSECGDFDLAEFVDLDVWQVVQFASDPKNALMARRSRVRLRNARLVLLSAAGEGIGDRRAVVADVEVWDGRRWTYVGEAWSTHVPPRYAPDRQHVHLERLGAEVDLDADEPMIVGGDFNQRVPELRARYRRAVVRGREVLAVVAVGARLGRARARRVGSDHPGVMVPWKDAL